MWLLWLLFGFYGNCVVSMVTVWLLWLLCGCFGYCVVAMVTMWLLAGDVELSHYVDNIMRPQTLDRLGNGQLV